MLLRARLRVWKGNKMPKFRVYATYEVCLYAEVDAKDEQEAYEKAKEMDGGDFVECSLGDWHIESDVDLIQNAA